MLQTQSNADLPTAKVVLLGDSGTGKTSLALRFAKNEFHPYTESTIGASFLTKILPLQSTSSENEGTKRKSGKEQKQQYIQFNIWDTAGQEKYHSLTPMYYRGADSAILVYDICSEVAFDSLHRWAQELKNRGPPDLVIVVCGNKCDLKDRRRISRERAEGYAQSIGALYVETSARDDINVNSMFLELAHVLKGKLRVQGDYNLALCEDGGTIDLGIVSEKRSCC